MPYHACELSDMEDAATGCEGALEGLHVGDELLGVRAVPVQRTPSSELEMISGTSPL